LGDFYDARDQRNLLGGAWKTTEQKAK